MEEYEKRKERLRAMRVEADEANSNSNNFTTPEIPCSLSNPLAEASLQEESPSNNNNRFDYYTDPMSAFTANKRRNDNTLSRHSSSQTPRPGPRIAEPTPRAHQYQGHYIPPDQRMYQPRAFSHNPTPTYTRPYNEYQGNQNYPIRPGPMGMSGPYNAYQGNPNHTSRPNFASNYNNYNSPPIPRPEFGRTTNPYHGGQERFRGINGPSYVPGRGRGYGRGRGGGRGSGGYSSGPASFYNESMIEDPWKLLEPVVWNEVKATPSGLGVRSPVGPKKARISDDSNSKSDSQPSLAEYLAVSFNEGVHVDLPNEQKLL